MKSVIAVCALLSMVGCASITSESTQLVRVDALDDQGSVVADATCQLRNDKGEYNVKAGQHAQINKSAKDLNITCIADNQDGEAIGTAISRAGAGMFGNILFGGGVGAIIDHNRGTAYNYPDWVQVVFGKVLVFDRSQNKQGAATPGEEAEGMTQTVASSD